ncbi:ROK family protein [Streptomyces sp. NPDC048376]|uniref:ROK family protein n=1 Tax=Streptomyces sp. NPDC048376 TaxID=3154926 RepID=UPI00341BE6DC
MAERLTVGIDVGGTKTAAVLLSGTGEVLATVTEPTDRSHSPRQCADHAVALTEGLLRTAGRPRDALGAVGVGLPGLIAPDRTFRDSIILPAWRNVDFGACLEPRLNLPVVVDNDATMAALGHLAGLPERHRPSCLVCLTLGTGVGGAVLLHGVPMRGPDGTAGQIGHTTVDPTGRPCACGATGCLNAYASGTAITSRYLELRAEARSGDDGGQDTAPGAVNLAESLRRQDPSARRALDEAVRALVVSISGVVNVLNPELVVLGGGVADLGPSLTDPVQAGVARRSFPAPARRVRVCRAAHGSLTGAMGAAVTAAGPEGAGRGDPP